MLGRVRELIVEERETGATAFPPPIARRRRRGRTSPTDLASLESAHGTNLALSHPSPCPSPTIRAFTPVCDGLWGEGTVWAHLRNSPDVATGLSTCALGRGAQ